MRAIGLMSGTSMDGVDAAVIETDGEVVQILGPSRSTPFDDDTRQVLRKAVVAARRLDKPDPTIPEIKLAGDMCTRLHIDAVNYLMSDHGLNAADIDVVGFHGQTINHRPDLGWTWQIGDGAALAEAVDIDVVADFRSNDVASGGQGAPFAPIYHWALSRSPAPGLVRPSAWPIAVLNVGGVSNPTWIPSAACSPEDMIAFDSGPGNALIDDWMLKHTGRAIDENGAHAREGRVHEDVLARLMDHVHFDLPVPKSLDRHDFSLDAVEGLSLDDGAATLVAFTAAAVAKGMEHMPAAPKAWYVTGGGRHNPALMDALEDRLKTPITSVEALGWRGDDLEAELFAYLAVRSLKGLPLTMPGTTGVEKPVTGGRLFKSGR
jgi:anhydro-N-acetylmuramic acid kinase